MRGKQKVWEPTIEKNSSGNDSINFTFIEREQAVERVLNPIYGPKVDSRPTLRNFFEMHSKKIHDL